MLIHEPLFEFAALADLGTVRQQLYGGQHRYYCNQRNRSEISR